MSIAMLRALLTSSTVTRGRTRLLCNAKHVGGPQTTVKALRHNEAGRSESRWQDIKKRSVAEGVQ